jgi:hypothetical protein
MSSKRTITKKPPPAKKVAPVKKAPRAKKPEGETKEAAPRHPRARVVKGHESKAALAKTLAESLARADEDTGVIAERLKTASNHQLLRLHNAVTTMKDKYGSRDKLIAAIGKATNKGTDKDYLAALDKLSLPNLLDLVKSHERRARA